MIKLIAPADVITLTNAVFGFLAVLFLVSPPIFSEESHIEIAFVLILFAILADGLDGIVARKTRHGKLGEYLEAMADMTSLGIAPAVFVYKLYGDMFACSPFLFMGLIILLLLFIVCGIIRLSSFHIIKQQNFFLGLPASASTIIVIVTTFVGIPFFAMLILLLVVSLAMIAPIPFLKPGVRINSTAGILILLTILFRHAYVNVFPLLLFFAVIMYIVGGLLYVKFHRL